MGMTRSADLGDHVLAFRQLRHRRPPSFEHFVGLPRVRTDAQRTPEVVEHDRRVWERARQVRELRDLRMVQPSLEAEVARGQLGEARPERRVQEKVLRGAAVGVPDGVAGVPARGMADAAKPGAGRAVGVEHLADPVTQHQVRVTDDAGADAVLAVASARGHRRHAVDELRLAHRHHGCRTAGPIHAGALDKHGADDVVPAADVREHFVQQVAASWMVPEVVVGIADPSVRIEDGLLHAGEPSVAILHAIHCSTPIRRGGALARVSASDRDGGASTLIPRLGSGGCVIMELRKRE